MRIYRYQSEEQIQAVNSIGVGIMNQMYTDIYEGKGMGILLEDGKATGLIYDDEEEVSYVH